MASTGTDRTRARLVVGAMMLCIVVVAILAAPATAAAYEAVSGTFWSGTGSYAANTKVVAGDVNGDGITDMVQFYRRSSSASSVYLFRSTGTGMVKSTAWSGTRAWTKTQIAATDYDGDGKCGLLLLYDRGGNTCSVYVMTSSGSTFSSPREIYRSATGKMAFSRSRLTAGDPDNDHLGEAIVYYESGSGHASIKVIGKAMSLVYGAVESAADGTALSGVGVTVFNSTGGTIGFANTDADGSYSISVPGGTGYRVAFTATDYLTANYYNLVVSGSGGTSLETVKLVAAGASGAGSASGLISDAFNGTPISGLSLVLHDGYNNPGGALSGYSVTSDVNGNYSFTGVPGGYYTAQVTGAGYATASFTVVVIGGTSLGNQNMSITPVLLGSDIRFVLTWGESPADLDSHLTGPISGSTRFHVYFSNKLYPSTGTAVATLDHDDTSSYGPETITLTRTSGGVYRYSVFDYTDRAATTGSALAGSGAQVRVYQGSSLIGTYNVPNHAGNLWKVLEISGSTVTPLNTMSFYNGASVDIP